MAKIQTDKMEKAKVKTENNKIAELLVNLGICKEDSIEPCFPRVRDRDDVGVLKCNQSGVIFLDRSDHMDITHYEEKQFFRVMGSQDRTKALVTGHEDAQRRADQFRYLIANKKWIDVGTGAGGILDILSPFAAKTLAVEPQAVILNTLKQLGYHVFPSIENVPDQDIEVATLFHVLEHLTEPIETLRSIQERMKEGGKIIVEVPHANDFLISFLDNEDFKAFTFWSEHLILHTRESLRIFLEAAGFENVVVQGFQRYPLANHLRWLKEGKPGGHQKWSYLRTEALDQAYSDMLARMDKTDTLIAIAEKGNR